MLIFLNFDKNVNASEDDFNNIVDIQNPTDSQIKEINEFIAQIVNDVRSQVGRPRVGVTTSNIKEVEAIAKDNEAHNSTNAVYLNSTNHPTVGFDVEFDGVSYGVGVSNAFQTHTDLKKKSASMAEIKEDLFNALMKIFFSTEARGNLFKAETLILNGYDLGAHYAFYENNGDPISQLVIAFCWSDDNPYDSGDDNAKYMDNYRKLGMAQGGDVAKAVQKVYDDDVNAANKAFISKTELQNLETKRAKQAKALDEATLAYQTFYDEASSKAFDNIRTTKEKETVASVKYNNALKALSQKQQEKALKVAKAKQALVPIEAKREEAQKALDVAKQNTAKAQYDLRVAKGDLSEAVIFKELKDKVAKNAKEDLAKANEIVDKCIAELDTARTKYNAEKAKLPKLEEAYKLALDKYNKDKDLYDTLVKAQEENNKHNQEVPTPSQGESSKGEETPEQPKEGTPSKGEETPEQPKEEIPTKGEETPEQPKEEIPSKGEETPEQPKEETPTKGEVTPSEDVPTVDPTKGSDTPSEDVPTVDPTKGQDTPAPSQGQDTPAPSQGQDTPAPSQGQDTPAPSRGQDTPAPSRGQDQPVLNKIVDTPAFEVAATNCYDSSKVTPDQIRGYLEDPGFIQQNNNEDYTAPAGYEEDPTVKGGYVNHDDGIFIPNSIAIRFYRPITTPAPTTPDTPSRGTDTPNRGSDTPNRGSDTPNRGSDTPNRGADTPSRGSDIPNSQTEGTSRNVNTTPVVAEGQIKTIKKTVKPIEKPSSMAYGNSSYVAPTSIKKDSLATQSLDNKQNDDKSSLPSTGETNTLSTLLSLSGITLLLSLFGIKAYRKN